MFRITRGLAILALGLTFLACETQEAEQQADIEEPAAVDNEAIRSGIEAADRRWEEGAKAADAAALASLYTEDAIVLAPGMERIDGRAQVEAAFGEMFAEPYDVKLETQDVMVSESGDMAVAIGQFEDAEATGKYIAVYENVNGEWLIVADAWNASGEGMPHDEGAADGAEETTE